MKTGPNNNTQQSEQKELGKWLSILPKVLRLYILSFLTPQENFSLSLLTKELNQVTNTPWLWQSYLKEYMPNLVKTSIEQYYSAPKKLFSDNINQYWDKYLSHSIKIKTRSDPSKELLLLAMRNDINAIAKIDDFHHRSLLYAIAIVASPSDITKKMFEKLSNEISEYEKIFMFNLSLDFNNVEALKIIFEHLGNRLYNTTKANVFKRAASTGNIEILTFLYEKARGSLLLIDIITAFRESAAFGHENVTKFLFQNERKSILPINIECAFSRAGAFGHIKVVKYLYENANLDILLTTMIRLFNKSAAFGHDDVVEFLYEQLRFKLTDENIKTALSEASKHGHLKVVKFLIDKYEFIETALVSAGAHGYINIVKFLFENASKNISLHTMIDTFEKASAFGHDEIVVFLFEKKNYKPPIENIKNALRDAIRHDHLKVVKFLIAKVGTQDRSLLLSYAAKRGKTEIATYLREHYFNTNNKNNRTYINYYSIKQCQSTQFEIRNTVENKSYRKNHYN